LCEKPLSIDARGARAMLAEAARAGVPFTVASKFRFVEDVARAKRIIDGGTIGEPVLFENSFTSPVDMRGRWNSDPAVSGGGVLIDHGPHSVDLVRHLCGPVAEIFAVEGSRSQGLAVEETVHVVARASGGALAIVDLSWSIGRQSDAYIQVHGTLGALSVGFRESTYRLYSSPDRIAFGSGYDKVRAFRDQIENFSRVIRGEGSLLVTAEDGLASSEVIEAGYAALASGEWTAVASAGIGRRGAFEALRA
jgi:predicted dehydrogenase